MNNNTLTKILHWFAVTLLFANIPPFSAQATSAEQSDAPAFIQLNVDTQSDFGDPAHQVCTALPNDCSLRGAISKANVDTGQSYQVSLPAGTYTLSIQGTGEDANATGDLDVRARLLITGAGAGNTSIDAQDIDRVFQIHTGASLTIQGATITGGHTMDGAEGIPGGDSEDGGGIYNAGVLVLTDSIVSSNSTGAGGPGVDGSAGNGYHAGHGGRSGKGGGIYNNGWLILDRTDLLSNRTGNGGNGGSNPIEGGGFDCGFGGSSGDGGGIYTSGILWLKESRLVNNTGGSGGVGGVWWWKQTKCEDGPGASGGGVYNTGHMQVQGSLLNINSAGRGGFFGGKGGGIYSANSLKIDDSQVNHNRTSGGYWGADGGGIYSTGWLEINHSHVNGNITAGGTLGFPGGLGGGIYTQGQALISDGLIEGNRTGDGGTGSYSPTTMCWFGGYGGSGGGIVNTGSLILENTTLKDNQTGRGGDGGGYCNAVGGRGGAGSGIYNTGTADIRNSPVIGNVAGNGGGSPSDYYDIYYSGGLGGPGGGIYNTGDLTLTFSPVLGNTAGQGGLGDTAGEGGPGGGIYNAGSLVSHFSPVTGNTAGSGGSVETDMDGKGGDGGGIYNENGLELLGILVNKNSAGLAGGPNSMSGDGGGIFISAQGTLTMTNAIVAENLVQQGGKGSGIYLMNSARLIHTTLASNSGGDGSGIYFIGPSLTLTNTILVSHTVGITTSGGNVLLDSTLWGSGLWANLVDWSGSGSHISNHNYYGDPGFADPANGNYLILPSSPAIDQGVQTTTVVDIENQPRPNPSTGIPDLGADEYWLFTPISQVSINGQSPISATLEVPFTAIVSPADATPNFGYYWSPHPYLGQGTDTAIYKWSLLGTYPITVTTWNAGSITMTTLQVTVVNGPNPVFLPVFMKHVGN